MLDRSAILRTAWANYRRLFSDVPFDRRIFGNCLRNAWRQAKATIQAEASFRMADEMKAQRRAADPAAAEREDRIAELHLLSSRYRVAPMIDAIRAEPYRTII